ncbi:hypothetical protein SAMN06297229_1798 [Pseudidiomarina planktonica]|uniref:DUF1415 domain-containing protein n=1 Tax=Pseudidiomarina planktonica TaxID=1323738 RepID=A0A1Y6FWB7_9GAMM|nr:DUF1415 domain-containing protein [Pseudidiomarina planktonica]RUO64030.1 DUF1415 domain-containing protein [Pseudidiomarina planktonica]SMQ79872.1 hypothetical protein SAMN06297229_1798 [Pseudidiomarina planktonica]
MANYIEHTQRWVEQLIVKYNICPFARRELERNSIRYVVAEQQSPQAVLTQLIDECTYLDEHPETETTLFILPHGYEGFYQYLDLLDLANDLLLAQNYEGVYQLASFHPDYCFDGELQSDAANYTNRAPYPILHLLRESSLEQALANYEDPENIPQRNMEFARRKGADFFEQILTQCVTKTDKP